MQETIENVDDVIILEDEEETPEKKEKVTKE